MSIESLKQQARKHEQNEDWQKALDQYNKALAELAREEQVDIGLYNRVGDLNVRIGALDAAVEHYERAVELYREAYLPNNAIAVCKKIIRNVPERHKAYLVIGQIRAEQGFLPDARTNFLTYAERMAGDGHLDESFRALIEFCDLAPDDVGVRVTVADQMVTQGRQQDAVEQLAIAHRHYVETGDTEQAQQVAARITEIDPEADVEAMVAGLPTSSVSSDGEIMADFGEIALGDDAFDTGSEAEVAMEEALEEASSDDEAEEVEVDAGLGGFEIDAAADDEDDEGEAVELPMMGFDEDDEGEAVELPGIDFEPEEDEGEAVELPTMDFDDDEGEAVELPTIEFESDEETGGEAVELPTMEFESEGGSADLPGADFEFSSAEEGTENADADTDSTFDIGGVEIDFDEPSGAAEAMQGAVEEVASDGIAVEPAPVEPEADASIVAEPIEASEPIAPAPPAAPPPPPATPPAAPEPAAAEPAAASGGGGEEFVDLGAMILGGGEEKSTRFTVQYEEPTGDEEADFAKMLAQFKDKVSENLDSSDVRAHYDLGTAYKEMGLLDEAIGSFQAALRASADHLPTYELMGQTFIEMGQPEAAVKSLERAVESATAVEDELVGIYYYLGRAYEELDNRQSAVEYYDRVFSLDINFADVTERLRELR